MPNHITNILEIEGDISEIEKLKSLVKTKDTNFSIENYFPIPKNIEEQNESTTSVPTWYNWRISNWGTKWDVYEVSEWNDSILTGEVPNNTGLSKITFLTAWATPFPALIKLTEIFPNLIIKCKFADEDMGSNCGRYILYNLELIDEVSFEKYSSESLKYAESVMEESYF
jgi:hypothetical protein